MTLKHYLILAVLILIAFWLVYAVQIPLFRKERRSVRVVCWFVKLAVMTGAAYLLIAYASPFLWHTGYAFAALYLALLGDLTADLVSAFLKPEVRKKYRPFIAGLFTLAVSAYAVVNMQTIVPAYHTYSSKKLSNTYKVIFFSDLHYGSSQSEQTVRNALQKIKEEQPDYLLLGGDIVDEHTTKEEMNSIFRWIGELGVPAYYIYGNHDRQDRGSYLGGKNYTEEELNDAITRSGITILYNDWTQAADDLVFLGMEDPSRPDKRIKVKDLRPRPDNAFVLCLEHTPYQNDDIAEMNADLQLSGHTHAGQLFPLRWIYELIGLNTYGEYMIDDTRLYVSPGITGWYLPLRNEVHCNYEVITLQPEA